jgi:hypothetical protein
MDASFKEFKVEIRGELEFQQDVGRHELSNLLYIGK